MAEKILDHVPGRIPADKEEGIETIDVIFREKYLIVQVADMILHVLQWTLIESFSERLILLTHLNQSIINHLLTSKQIQSTARQTVGMIIKDF